MFKDMLPQWIRKNFISEESQDPNLDVEIEFLRKLVQFTSQSSRLKWLKHNNNFEVVLLEKNPEIKLILNPLHSITQCRPSLCALRIVHSQKTITIIEPIPEIMSLTGRPKYKSEKEKRLADLMKDLSIIIEENIKNSGKQVNPEEKNKIIGATLSYLLTMHGE